MTFISLEMEFDELMDKALNELDSDGYRIWLAYVRERIKEQEEDAEVILKRRKKRRAERWEVSE